MSFPPSQRRRFSTSAAGVGVILLAALSGGCSLGPRSIELSRLRYNEAVKRTADQQLLLNIVRLRFTDTPSSLSVSSIADQHELTAGLGLTPFFAPASAGDFGGYRGTVLPQFNLGGATRPTLSYTPQDDEEFAKKLFTPLSLEGITYLVKTTWPISTVFRLYLENLNWISNAETGSGPTPRLEPDFRRFRAGVDALQSLQDQKLLAFNHRSEDVSASDPMPLETSAGAAAVEAAKSELELRRTDDRHWQLVRKAEIPTLRIAEAARGTPEFEQFCEAFSLEARRLSFDLTLDEVDPFHFDIEPARLKQLDLETRSLLQVLFFLSHGVEVPPELIAKQVVPLTFRADGGVFDWHEVLEGLFAVKSSVCAPQPGCAAVEVYYQGYWYYIDASDRDSKATFNLLIELSRQELGNAQHRAPMLTLPLGGR